MATFRQYATQLFAAQQEIALRLGSNLSEKNNRILVQSLLATIAILVKAIVDKGLLTDQELIAARNAVLGETWPEEEDNPR